MSHQLRALQLMRTSLQEFLPPMPLVAALTPTPEFFALSFIGDPPLLRAIAPRGSRADPPSHECAGYDHKWESKPNHAYSRGESTYI